MRKPKRGEVWIADLGMAAKTRPVVVLSIGATIQDRAIVTAVPHTTRVRGTRFEVNIPTRFLEIGAFDIQGIAAVSEAKFIKRIGFLSAEQQTLIDDKLREWLGL